MCYQDNKLSENLEEPTDSASGEIVKKVRVLLYKSGKIDQSQPHPADCMLRLPPLRLLQQLLVDVD